MTTRRALTPKWNGESKLSNPNVETSLRLRLA